MAKLTERLKGYLRNPRMLNLSIAAGIVVLVNILASFFFTHWDLTDDKRYSITGASKQLIEQLEHPVTVTVYLEGSFPAGFKRLQAATLELLQDYRRMNAGIEYTFIDPNAGSTEEVNQMRKELADQGILPTNLRVKDQEGTSDKLIYPYAILQLGERKLAVNLLENELIGVSPDEVLNNSISLLEYKFSSGIQKLMQKEKPLLLVTEGNGEYSDDELKSLFTGLGPFYYVDRVNLDSIVRIDSLVDVLIVARPQKPISEKNKFKIDQFIMRGGKVIWYVESLAISMDSLAPPRNSFVPPAYDLNLEDMLYKYGVRIEPDLILDLDCTRIPLITGNMGGGKSMEMFPFYYHPLVAAKSEHPIVKSIDRTNLIFASSIDTIKTKTPVHKEIILSSSDHSRLQYSPVSVGLEILRYEPDPKQFDKKHLPVGVLLEGEFPSLFENRVSAEMLEGLQQLGQSFLTKSRPTKMLVFSDGDLIRSDVYRKSGKPAPIGYNKYEDFVFKGNSQLIYNIMEYLNDDSGIITARSKNIKMRLLDRVRVDAEKTKWQVLNLMFPLLMLTLGGMLFLWIRKKKYA